MSGTEPEQPDQPAGQAKKPLTPMGWCVIGVVVFLGIGWVRDKLDPDHDKPLSSAFCSDLEDGMLVSQIMIPQIRNGTYEPKEAADLSYGYAKISCPEQLETNTDLRTYLEGWGIDPDA